VADDDWRNRYRSGRKAEQILPVRCVEKALRKTDPTRAESDSVRGEHQILGSQCTVLDDPGTLHGRRNQEEHRRAIEDMKIRIIEQRSEVVRLGACGHGREHMGLGVTRDAIEHTLVAHDRECPRLLVYRVRRVHGRVDQTTDYSLIDRLGRIFAQGAAAEIASLTSIALFPP
jgi:hypothetical protein